MNQWVVWMWHAQKWKSCGFSGTCNIGCNTQEDALKASQEKVPLQETAGLSLSPELPLFSGTAWALEQRCRSLRYRVLLGMYHFLPCKILGHCPSVMPTCIQVCKLRKALAAALKAGQPGSPAMQDHNNVLGVLWGNGHQFTLHSWLGKWLLVWTASQFGTNGCSWFPDCEVVISPFLNSNTEIWSRKCTSGKVFVLLPHHTCHASRLPWSCENHPRRSLHWGLGFSSARAVHNCRAELLQHKQWSPLNITPLFKDFPSGKVVHFWYKYSTLSSSTVTNPLQRPLLYKHTDHFSPAHYQSLLLRGGDYCITELLLNPATSRIWSHTHTHTHTHTHLSAKPVHR